MKPLSLVGITLQRTVYNLRDLPKKRRCIEGIEMMAGYFCDKQLDSLPLLDKSNS